VVARPLGEWLALLDERARGARRVTLVAEGQGEARGGMAFVWLEGRSPFFARLSGMWVEPEARR